MIHCERGLRTMGIWLLLLVLWCTGASQACAQQEEKHPAETQDTIPAAQMKRDRKTASGHARKKRIEEVKDSIAERTRQQADSILAAKKAAKGDTLALDSVLPEAKGDTLVLDSVQLKAMADSLSLDSTRLSALSDSLLQAVLAKRKQQAFRPDPIRSMWLGLVFPGGGQIYNRKYWKLPIFYGGFLGCAYALTWNGQMLRDYSQAYLDIMDDDPNTKSYEQMLPLGYDISGKEERFKEIFKNKKNYFRKYRDMSIFAFAGVYLLAVIDAYVDAELSSFDISPDLSMRLGPTLLAPCGTGMRHLQAAPGIQCSLTF
ncbi:MAG: DUF5683 domain-containing protein [Bacteroidaceae bacterium]|nr:DUF5683 domain-containing protein [Bacteroidaceae bacterium]